MTASQRTQHSGPKCNLLLHWLGVACARAWGWNVVGELPATARMVIIGAPHTSNWDFVHMLMAVFAFRLRVCWLGKHTLFVWPLGPLLRALGGIAVDRGAHGDSVRQLAEQFETASGLALVIAPEGTRSRTPFWRSGFYAIAERAHVPIVCGYIDYARREIGMGYSFVPSGDRDGDMARCRAFYSEKRGRYPAFASDVRLQRDHRRP